MKFRSLLNLERLVLEKLSPPEAIGLEAEIQEFRSLISQVEKDVKQTFKTLFVICANNELLGRHLDRLYKQCRNLSDTLHAYGAGQGLQAELRAEVQSAMTELLDYLLERHDDLLSPSLTVSNLHLEVSAKGLEEGLGMIVSLMKRYHVDAALQAIIVSKITKLRDSRKVSWSQIRHLENIVRYIRTEFNGRFDNGNASLCNYLQRSNYNTQGFLNYCKLDLNKQLEDQLGPVEAYSRLCDLEKTYKTAYYKKNAVPYEPRLPQVKVAMLEYVRAEMDCLRKKERGFSKPVVLIQPPTPASARPQGEEIIEKLSLSMSVDVLVCFFRLLISAGVVTNPSKASVFRFISRHVETPGAAARDISLKSLENKFKQVRRSALITNREILVKMLNQIDEECA